jgi:hypothetical protein
VAIGRIRTENWIPWTVLACQHNRLQQPSLVYTPYRSLQQTPIYVTVLGVHQSLPGAESHHCSRLGHCSSPRCEAPQSSLRGVSDLAARRLSPRCEAPQSWLRDDSDLAARRLSPRCKASQSSLWGAYQTTNSQELLCLRRLSWQYEYLHSCQLRVCWCGASSLRIGSVWGTQLLLILASVVDLGLESRSNHGRIILFQILDCPNVVS